MAPRGRHAARRPGRAEPAAAGAAAAGAAAAGLWRRYGEDDDPGRPESIGSTDPEQASSAAAGGTDLWGRPRQDTSPADPATVSGEPGGPAGRGQPAAGAAAGGSGLWQRRGAKDEPEAAKRGPGSPAGPERLPQVRLPRVRLPRLRPVCGGVSARMTRPRAGLVARRGLRRGRRVVLGFGDGMKGTRSGPGGRPPAPGRVTLSSLDRGRAVPGSGAGPARARTRLGRPGTRPAVVGRAGCGGVTARTRNRGRTR